MNKRSAMLMAAGLVSALAIGAAAMSLSLGGDTATAESRARVKPVVKTIRDTVTIHKGAEGSDDGPTVVTLRGSSADLADDVGEGLEDAEHESDDRDGDDDHESDNREDAHEHEEGHDD